MDYTGTWHICKMEMWDAEYFNMETQAHITIDSDNMGDFQFGLVSRPVPKLSRLAFASMVTVMEDIPTWIFAMTVPPSRVTSL